MASQSEQLTTDQRGEPRPGGTMCDVGAFEVQEGSLRRVELHRVQIDPGVNLVREVGEVLDPLELRLHLVGEGPCRHDGGDPDARKELRRQMVAELFDFLRPRATEATFRELCDLLAEDGDTDLDATSLPVAG